MLHKLVSKRSGAAAVRGARYYPEVQWWAGPTESRRAVL